MRVLLAIAVLGSLSVLARAQDIDKLLDAQNKPAKTTSTVDASVNKTANESAQAVATRHAELEKRRREMAAAAAADKAYVDRSSTNSNPSTAATGSAWKIVRQYEGGFSEFGFDTRHTIFVVRCRSGAEHKLYRDKNGKWGSVGAGFNNSAASLEMAASQKCN